MCDQCDEIDRKIGRFSKLVDVGMDDLTRERTAKFIAELKAEKAKIVHPEQG